MKKLVSGILVVLATAGVFGGCSYAGMTASGDLVAVARNDEFLAGLLRTVYVCKLTAGGLTDCRNAESP